MQHSHHILKVALPLPLRRCFDYLPPKETTSDQLLPGIRVEVPFGNRQLIGILVGISNSSNLCINKLKLAHKIIDQKPVITEEIMTLARWCANYYHHPLGEVMTVALPASLRNGDQVPDPKLEYYYVLTSSDAINCADNLKRAPKQKEIIDLISQHPDGMSEHSIKALGLKGSALNSLMDKGLITIKKIHLKASHAHIGSILAEAPLELNKEQQVAVLAVIASLHQFKTFLLDGVTGSGKTEVYMQIIESVLQNNRSALLLVPEIGLTPQTVSRFKNRFNFPVLVLHSKRSANERLHDWLSAKNGDACIIIGTRSAIFTPTKRLGVIIIDEEHDLSYKQQDGLRYSARDSAIIRARQANIPILLASATPSLDSLYNVKQSKYQLLSLSKRAGNAILPKFVVLDIRNSKLQDGIAPQAIKAIKKTLAAKEQILIFINRRGFAPALICHSCGWTGKCDDCNKPYTLHLNPPLFRCHHCDAQKTIPTSCPQCRSTQIKPIGVGTERAEKGLEQLFPQAKVYRIDRDSTRKKTALKQILNSINKGEPSILVGTQMLAKGHHFPLVTLVVILEVDSGFLSSDFRATEKTGQMIAQVAGRSGRADKLGTVLIQTHQPDNLQLTTLIKQGYGCFARQLLEERKEAELPPWHNSVIIRAESIKEKNPYTFLTQVRDYILNVLNENHIINKLEVYGPLAPTMSKKAGRHRAQLILQSESRVFLQHLLTTISVPLESMESGRKVRWSIDVDPQDSM